MVNGNENYQKYLLCLFILMCVVNAIPLTGFGLFFYNPDYICIDHLGNQFKCTKNIACQNNQHFKFDNTIMSLNYIYELSCEKELTAVKLSFIIFVMAGIFVPFFSLLDRKIGKKGMLLLSMQLSFIAYIIEALSNSFYISCFSVFVLLLCIYTLFNYK